ncbi:hypothetical protein NDU88_002641 [Pleurodeles waltl]|uniref:Uncharacterized protein n=1 Tax=Pleurodeles waltl TaxID=8319 RepID=A0AAV7W561_PLEWA|nr:hypothetical protein NDU88_002641 [Pleurodeles waltl]
MVSSKALVAEFMRLVREAAHMDLIVQEEPVQLVRKESYDVVVVILACSPPGKLRVASPKLRRGGCVMLRSTASSFMVSGDGSGEATAEAASACTPPRPKAVQRGGKAGKSTCGEMKEASADSAAAPLSPDYMAARAPLKQVYGLKLESKRVIDLPGQAVGGGP